MSVAHSSELRYRLYKGVRDTSPLCVVKCRDIVWQRINIRLSILAASHAITIRHPDGRVLTEVLACLPTGFCDETIWSAGTLRATGAAVVANGLSLSVAIFRRPGLPPGFPEIEGTGGQISFQFPEPSGGAAGLTAIDWAPVGSGLRIRTAHTYPEEAATIHTVTTVSLSGKYGL